MPVFADTTADAAAAADTTADRAAAPVDATTFREAMSLLAAPLTVVTTRDPAGRRWGFTASSVTSASLAPPLVMVGLSNGSSCRAALTESAEFVISILGEEQSGVARRFATPEVDRFAEHRFEDWPGSRLPRLLGAHAALRCRLADLIPLGDHQLLIGEPTGLHTDAGTTSRPLLWHRRDFRTTAHDGTVPEHASISP